MKRRGQFGEEQGQAMAEFTIVLPIVVLVLFGIIQFGIVFNNYETLTDATRAGARVGAVARGSSNPTQNATTAVQKAATDLNQSNLSITVSSTWGAGSDVTVTATYPYSISLLGVVVKSGYLRSSTTERVE